LRALDISAIAINEDTLALARCTNRKLWSECIEKTSLILLSPEQLVSQAFEKLLQHRTFYKRLYALGVHEVYLVQDWGDPSFRKAFRHIALVLGRMLRGTTMVALTTNLLPGEETTELLKTLGLVPGAFFFQTRSNARHDIEDIYRVLRHGLSSCSFSDLAWIVEGDQKILIYCEVSKSVFVCTYTIAALLLENQYESIILSTSPLIIGKPKDASSRTRALTLVGVVPIHLLPNEILAYGKPLNGGSRYLEGPILVFRLPTIHPEIS